MGRFEILIVDDHPVVVSGCKALLASEPDIEVLDAPDAETGLAAYDEVSFGWETIWWYFRNTGIPMSFGTTIILGFIVGMVICGQTFYLFVVDNLRHLGALKAMGGKADAQQLKVFLVGYGLDYQEEYRNLPFVALLREEKAISTK